MVGESVGISVGASVGAADGAKVGALDGEYDGANDGAKLGAGVGSGVGGKVPKHSKDRGFVAAINGKAPIYFSQSPFNGGALSGLFLDNQYSPKSSEFMTHEVCNTESDQNISPSPS